MINLKDLKETAAKLKEIIKREEDEIQREKYAGKVFIEKVSPENTVSPLEPYESWNFPENVFVFGNKDLIENIPAKYKSVYCYFDEIKEDFENSYFHWRWNSKKHWLEKAGEKRPGENEESLQEILKNYGIEKESGEKFTRKELKEIKKALSADEEREENIAYFLTAITGNDWEAVQISGCCQGDWNYIVYNVSELTKKDVEIFEAEYFNTGTEYAVYYSEEEAEAEEPAEYVYTHFWDDDENKKEIADAIGCNIKDIMEV